MEKVFRLNQKKIVSPALENRRENVANLPDIEQLILTRFAGQHF